MSLMVLMVSQMLGYVQTHQIEYIKYVQFFVDQFQFNEGVKNKRLCS